MSDLCPLLSASVRCAQLGVRVRTLNPRPFWHAYIVKGAAEDVGIGLTEAGAVENLLDRVEAKRAQVPA
jgi:hypothetical protein